MRTHNLEVTYEDGRVEKVTADQRDRAGYELSCNGSAIRAMAQGGEGVWRYLAWHALKRTKRTNQEWSAWTDDAVEVDILPDDEEEDTSADPGQPTVPATSS